MSILSDCMSQHLILYVAITSNFLVHKNFYPLFLPLNAESMSISFTESTLACLSDLDISPDSFESFEKSQTDEHLNLPSSPSHISSYGSDMPSESEASFSVSSVRSMQSNNLSDIGEFFHLRTRHPNNPLVGFLIMNRLV